MNDFRNFREERRQRWEKRMERHGEGHIWTGLFLLVIGGVALAKSFGAPLPEWLFTWQMLLIAIGLLIGLKKGFRDGGWFVPILIGGVFMANEYFFNGELRQHIWPLILIIVGVFIILKAGRKKWTSVTPQKNTTNLAERENLSAPDEENITQDDFINSTCIFSGAKKVILSKKFKGGDMVNIFGGCEIDLTQADMTSTAVLDVTAIFGGATLIVPSNWAIKSEAVTIFGGIGDKRKILPMTEGPSKTLVLKGTMIFGGMEIRSY
jgi:predicted membrane protein